MHAMFAQAVMVGEVYSKADFMAYGLAATAQLAVSSYITLYDIEFISLVNFILDKVNNIE